MSTATLAGIPVMRATAHIPAWGLWWADVELDSESTLVDRQDLVIADLTLKGQIVSGGSWLGRSRYRIAGGYGWCRSLKAKGYANDAGVKWSKIIGDAATECGEQTEGIPNGIAGFAYDRLVGPASACLNILASQNWYIGEDGVTRFGRRVGTSVGEDVTRGEVDFAAGSIELMSDSIASLLPGATCEGMTAVDVTHVLEAKKLRTTLYGSAFGPSTKRLLAWSRLIEQMRPFDRYRGTWEYRVVRQSGERLDLQPVAVRFGLPDLRAVRVRPGAPGLRAGHALGSLVLVAFVNADPARPVVTGFDDAESPGFVPSRLDLVGEDDLALLAPDPTGRVLRYGDVVCMPTGPGATPVLYILQPMPQLISSPYISASRVRA